LARPAVVAVAVLGVLVLSSCRSPEPEPAAAALRFYREHVTVEPSEGRVRVLGVYYFRNESERPLATAIEYPFPVDRFQMVPFRIRVWERTDSGLTPLGFIRGDASVRWQMRFAPHEDRTVQVEYVQEIKRNRAVYIVTTTHAWGRPIELAEFEFRIPALLKGVDLSFEPDSVSVAGDTTVYFMRATDFLPDSDLTVTWQ
jgi:hypothetical protein